MKGSDPEKFSRKRRAAPLCTSLSPPLEWHGPAMPYGTDPLAAWHAAILSAQQTGGVVLPLLYAGTERERSPKLLSDAGFEGYRAIHCRYGCTQ